MLPFLVDKDLNKQHVMVVDRVSIPTSCVSPANEHTSEKFAVQVVNQCKNHCKKSVRCEQMELPDDFTADHFTAIRNRGYLIFVTVPLFQTFRIIESIIQTHFEPICQMYVEDSFPKCITKIARTSCPCFL